MAANILLTCLSPLTVSPLELLGPLEKLNFHEISKDFLIWLPGWSAFKNFTIWDFSIRKGDVKLLSETLPHESL